jgi:hypothetical protein
MKINVTAKHIKMGVPSEADSCPIAHAVREAVNKSCLKTLLKDKRICVNESEITVGSLTMMPPQKAVKFIETFDEEKPVKPFSFNLRFE